ncbi:microtubule-associated protein Jupiter-like [Drosophila novamexicana]|uniref:microtubule-associated protein Jupiter-like n=1 Tax=Drosophila novamexicana TaxID=47314 RepID=UPI0011E5F48F|nr:microtubule-associated protein Jupiter-like [Drosophila novamexicana]
MSTKAQDTQGPLAFERDPACPLSAVPSAESEPTADILDIDRPCKDNDIGPVPLDNYTFSESDKHDVCLQSRRDSSTNPERPYSLNNMDSEPDLKEPLGPCGDYVEQSHTPCIKLDNKDNFYSRNPITGSGLNGDGVGGLKPKKLKNREGNPVTGEGYKPGATDFIQPAIKEGSQPMNSNNNGNRVPPGGYSSGLW